MKETLTKNGIIKTLNNIAVVKITPFGTGPNNIDIETKKPMTLTFVEKHVISRIAHYIRIILHDANFNNSNINEYFERLPLLINICLPYIKTIVSLSYIKVYFNDMIGFTLYPRQSHKISSCMFLHERLQDIYSDIISTVISILELGMSDSYNNHFNEFMKYGCTEANIMARHMGFMNNDDKEHYEVVRARARSISGLLTNNRNRRRYTFDEVLGMNHILENYEHTIPEIV